jgi:hypothetical protein
MPLQWANTLNRKSLSKQVIACSEHFLDGKPTERNPNSGDAFSTSSGHKTEHLLEAKKPQSVTMLPFADIVPVSVIT